ncbi:DUF3606 domain-containing protein [Mucilaginibacter sp. JRF]|nr:DUF3606 domain-containing protein [Mucilaginibacter sp. JRF]
MPTLRKRSRPDTRFIDIEDEYALIFWAKELDVSTKKIKNAVLAVGPLVIDVTRRLKVKPEF